MLNLNWQINQNRLETRFPLNNTDWMYHLQAVFQLEDASREIDSWQDSNRRMEQLDGKYSYRLCYVA